MVTLIISKCTVRATGVWTCSATHLRVPALKRSTAGGMSFVPYAATYSARSYGEKATPVTHCCRLQVQQAGAAVVRDAP